MSLPPRIRELIEEVAASHEVPPEDITNRACYRAAQVARLEAIRKASATPKPNGSLPSTAEVARWFERNWSTIDAAKKVSA